MIEWKDVAEIDSRQTIDPRQNDGPSRQRQTPKTFWLPNENLSSQICVHQIQYAKVVAVVIVAVVGIDWAYYIVAVDIDIFAIALLLAVVGLVCAC